MWLNHKLSKNGKPHLNATKIARKTNEKIIKYHSKNSFSSSSVQLLHGKYFQEVCCFFFRANLSCKTFLQKEPHTWPVCILPIHSLSFYLYVLFSFLSFAFISYVSLPFAFLFLFIPAFPFHSLPFPSHPFPFLPIPSLPFPSHPIPFLPIPSHPFPSHPIPFLPIPSLSCPSLLFFSLIFMIIIYRTPKDIEVYQRTCFNHALWQQFH